MLLSQEDGFGLQSSSVEESKGHELKGPCPVKELAGNSWQGKGAMRPQQGGGGRQPPEGVVRWQYEGSVTILLWVVPWPRQYLLCCEVAQDSQNHAFLQ